MLKHVWQDNEIINQRGSVACADGCILEVRSNSVCLFPGDQAAQAERESKQLQKRIVQLHVVRTTHLMYIASLPTHNWHDTMHIDTDIAGSP